MKISFKIIVTAVVVSSLCYQHCVQYNGDGTYTFMGNKRDCEDLCRESAIDENFRGTINGLVIE